MRARIRHSPTPLRRSGTIPTLQNATALLSLGLQTQQWGRQGRRAICLSVRQLL